MCFGEARSVRACFKAGNALAEIAHTFCQDIGPAIQGADIGAQPSGQSHHEGSLGTGHAYHRAQVRGQLSAETDSPSRHRHVSRAGPRIT